jgi:hypothetical protein
MAGDTRQHVDPGPRIEIKVKITGGQYHGIGSRQREGRAAKFHRIDPEEEVMHDRVADKGGVQHIGALCADIADQLADKGIDRLAHGLDEIRQFCRVHLDIGDPRHQVFAEADLRVRGAGGGDCAPVHEDCTDARQWWSSQYQRPSHRRPAFSPGHSATSVGRSKCQCGWRR